MGAGSLLPLPRTLPYLPTDFREPCPYLWSSPPGASILSSLFASIPDLVQRTEDVATHEPLYQNSSALGGYTTGGSAGQEWFEATHRRPCPRRYVAFLSPSPSRCISLAVFLSLLRFQKLRFPRIILVRVCPTDLLRTIGDHSTWLAAHALTSMVAYLANLANPRLEQWYADH